MKGDRLAGALTVGRSDDLAVAARLLGEGADLAGKRALVENPDTDVSAL